MFSAARIYKIESIYGLLEVATIEDLIQKVNARFEEFSFNPCTAQQVETKGFTPAFQDRHEGLVYSSGDFVLGAVKTQTKKLPSSFLQDQIRAKTQEYIQKEGVSPTRKQKAEWKEEISSAFLPNVVPVSKVTKFCFDVKSNVLYVDTATSSKAEDVLALIRKSFGSLPAVNYFDAFNLVELMQNWGRNLELPESFGLGSKIGFQAPDEEKATSNFKNVVITADDVQAQFEDKRCTLIEIDHIDKLTFTIKNDCSLAKIDFKEVVNDTSRDEEDALAGQVLLGFTLLRETIDLIDAKQS